MNVLFSKIISLKHNPCAVFAASLLAAALSAPLQAEIIPVSPAADSEVALIPESQKKIMALATHEERLAELNTDRTARKSYFNPKTPWRKALHISFAWKCTAGETGPFKLMISEKEDFSEPVIFFSKTETTLNCPRHANFKIGQKYFWKVVGMTSSKQKTESAAASFRTEDVAPRWIAIQSPVSNIRDLGGRLTLDGKRVRQGMIFRGQGLNNNSVTGEIPGRNRLMVDDRDYLLNVLKIRTDLDLRRKDETAGMTVSPLGPGVRFINRASPAYAGMFTESGKQVTAQNFRVFCDRKNYPIYFHCIAGADRTGSLAYILNGILGVPEKELELDWEHTFYPDLPDNQANGNPTYWRLMKNLVDGLTAKYTKPGDTVQQRIEKYLLDSGITPEEIAEFRSIMLE